MKQEQNMRTLTDHIVEGVFKRHPRRSAEYLGEIAKISIVLREPEEAGVRARLAASYARRVAAMLKEALK